MLVIVLVIGPHTAQALAPHIGARSWIVFVQVSPPGLSGPIKIEAVHGSQIGARLLAICADNPYPAYLIGLIESQAPDDHIRGLVAQLTPFRMHGDWFMPVPVLLQLIHHVGQAPLAELLAATRSNGGPDNVVDIEGIASVLGVSVPTVRRLINADSIPHFRVGRQYRFVVADVIAAMNRS